MTGTHQGTFYGPGPLLNRTPDTSNGGGPALRVLDDDLFTSTAEQSLTVRLHTLSLGPRAIMNFGRVNAQVGVGLALNIVDWSAKSDETLKDGTGSVLQQWHDSASGTELLPGAFGELGLDIKLSQAWSLAIAARYDYAQSFSGKVGASEFDFDLSGFTGKVGLEVNF